MQKEQRRPSTGFNSITVQLRLFLLAENSESFRRFNSITVQLRHGSSLKSRINARLFQFHNGTIKTRRPGEQGRVPARFQFHNGTIKTFNSIMQ